MADNSTYPVSDDSNDIIRDLTDSEGSKLTPEVAQEIAESIARILKAKKNVNVIVAGKTGVGKSTLIGSLLPNQRKHVDVKDGPASSDSYVLKEFAGTIEQTAVTVYIRHSWVLFR